MTEHQEYFDRDLDKEIEKVDEIDCLCNNVNVKIKEIEAQ